MCTGRIILRAYDESASVDTECGIASSGVGKRGCLGVVVGGVPAKKDVCYHLGCSQCGRNELPEAATSLQGLAEHRVQFAKWLVVQWYTAIVRDSGEAHRMLTVSACDEGCQLECE
jgi:hypothetical protein